MDRAGDRGRLGVPQYGSKGLRILYCNEPNTNNHCTERLLITRISEQPHLEDCIDGIDLVDISVRAPDRLTEISYATNDFCADFQAAAPT